MEKKETMRFVVDMPVDLHKKLKMLCIKNEISMRHVLVSIVAQLIKEEEEKNP